MLVDTFRGAMKERGWKGFSGWCKVVYLYLFKAYFWPLCAEHCPTNLTPFFHRLRGVKIGREVFIDRSVLLDGIYPELITIGDDARLAPGVIVCCHSKAGKLLSENYLPDIVKEVKIGESAQIGLGVVILPGVTIGKGAVVAAGSVLFNQEVPGFCVAVGNPARVVKRLKKLDKAPGD